MGLFGRKSSLPHYSRTPLDALLADPSWLTPLNAAGFTLANANLVRRVGGVMVADRGRFFSDGMPFLTAAPAVLIVQGAHIGLAVPDKKKILVIRRDLSRAQLMVSKFEALQLVWGNATVDGWTFVDLKVGSPDGQELGQTLQAMIHT